MQQGLSFVLIVIPVRRVHEHEAWSSSAWVCLSFHSPTASWSCPDLSAVIKCMTPVCSWDLSCGQIGQILVFTDKYFGT